MYIVLLSTMLVFMCCMILYFRIMRNIKSPVDKYKQQINDLTKQLDCIQSDTAKHIMSEVDDAITRYFMIGSYTKHDLESDIESIKKKYIN